MHFQVKIEVDHELQQVGSVQKFFLELNRLKHCLLGITGNALEECQ